MIEASRVAAFVWSALVADSGLGGVNVLLGGTPSTPGRIYQDQVPQAAALPAATVTLVSATDSNTLGGLRVFGAVLVDVRIVGTGASYGTIGPIADRADLVLQNRSGASGGVRVVELRREQVQRFVENEAGAAFSHILSTYRTEAYATPA